MLACIQRIIEAAKAVGGSVDLRSLNNGTIIVDAPPGYLWSATLTAALVERASNSGQSWFAAAAREIASDMRGGLRKCDADESREIEQERDEPWTAAPDAPEWIEVRM